MTHYVCTELQKLPDGYQSCKNWVAQQDNVLSQSQISQLGGVLVLFFACVVGYLLITKAIKTA